MNTKNNNFFMKWASNVLLIIFIFVIWHFGSTIYSPLLLPNPKQTCICIRDIIKSDFFIYNMIKTLHRLLLGIGYAIVAGTLLGIIMGINQSIKNLFRFAIYTLQSIPPVLFMTLAMIWFGLDGQAVIFIIFISSFPPLTINILEGFENIDYKLIEMAQLYHFSKFKMIHTIILPSLKTYVKSGLLIVLSLGWKLAVMGEVFCASNGLGAKMTEARLNLQTDMVFAWGIIIIFLCFLSQLLILLLFKFSNIRRKKHASQSKSNKKIF